MATYAQELKLDMANKIKVSHDDLMNRVRAFDARINKVEKLTMSVPILVKTVNIKLSESSNEFKKLGGKIDQNRESITELENSVKRINDEKPESSTSCSLPHIKPKVTGCQSQMS